MTFTKIIKNHKIKLIVLVLVIIAIIIFVLIKTKVIDNFATEYFEELPVIYKGSGFGFEKTGSERPLFINFYPKNLGTDFSLQGIIRKLRFLSKNIPTKANGLQFGIFEDDGQKNMGPKLSPIILIPGLGSTKIFARWNKQNTKSVKVDDAYGNFDTSEKWSCKGTQVDWESLWFPMDTDPLATSCWVDNVKIIYDQGSNSVLNNDGISTIVPDMGAMIFESTEMNTLINGLMALGYTPGSSLFGASYDFRKICSDISQFQKSFVSLVENSVLLNGRKAIIISHDLGTTVINYVLNTLDQAWKDKYIQCSIMFSPVIGGLSKALRTFLSGDNIPSNDNQISYIRDSALNFTGLQLMLPAPEVFGPRPLLQFRQVSYDASKISNLINMASSSLNNKDAGLIYDKIVRPFQKKSLEGPRVPVYVLAGINLDTESDYVYNDTLIDRPNKNTPYYKSNLPYETEYLYPSLYNGNGSVAKFVLDYPKLWASQQTEPVFFKFYERAEHVKILSMAEPVTDVLEIIREFNNDYN